MFSNGPRNFTIEKIKASGFVSTFRKRIPASPSDFIIAVDENRGEWLIVMPDGKCPKLFKYSELIDCIVDEVGDHNSLTSVSVRIITSDFSAPSIVIPVYRKSLFAKAQNREKWGARVYLDSARELQALFLSIKSRTDI